MKNKLIWGTAVFLTLVLVLAACTAAASEPEQLEAATTAAPTPEEIVVDLPDMGEAPEFRNDVWLNSEAPVKLADQRGKVVLLEFWTFG
ncbi:MAG: hypothetical protein H6653_08235 [Ardenticatenaceae bacterium]|nr:hypothetical protein [Ardenticatenaceae bacterium]